MIETYLKIINTNDIQIRKINLANSKEDNSNGIESSKLEYNFNKINENYDWMFSLSRGDMGFSHGISNKTGY